MRDWFSLHIAAPGNPIFKGFNGLTPFDGETWYYLKLTKLENACHPLYLKSDLKPIKF
jgi:hypothetical protein